MKYGEGTFLIADGQPFSTGFRGGRALCPDGVFRNVHPTTDGIADTFFSVPMFVYASNKRVYGYTTLMTRRDSTIGTVDDPLLVHFRPYLYRAWHSLVEPVMAGLAHEIEVAVRTPVRAFHPRALGVVWSGWVRKIDRRRERLLVAFGVDRKEHWIPYIDVVSAGEDARTARTL